MLPPGEPAASASRGLGGAGVSDGASRTAAVASLTAQLSRGSRPGVWLYS